MVVKTSNETHEPEMGLTFEKVWAILQESDRRTQETVQQMRETGMKTQEIAQRRIKTDEQIGRLGKV
jgi:hypothetical protein